MWFCAALLRVAERNGKRDANSLWEEQFVLVESVDEQQASKLVQERYGHDQAPYKNNKGDLIAWKFVAIERVYAIEQQTLNNGTEVFSRFLRDSEVQSLLTPFSEEPTDRQK